MKTGNGRWLTEAEVAAALNVSVEGLRVVLLDDNSLFDGWARVIDGEIWFHPGTLKLVERSRKFTHDVLSRKLGHVAAEKIYRGHARQEPPDADGKAQVRAVVKIRSALGNGDASREVIARTLPSVGAETGAINISMLLPLK